jgi:hypothetical protein
MLNRPLQQIALMGVLCASAAPASRADDLRRIMWCEHQLNGADVRRCKLDGAELVNVNSDFPWTNGLAIDPVTGRTFWADESAHTIRTGFIATTGSTVLVSTGVEKPQGLDIDAEHGRLYWADSALDQIKRCNLDGTGIEVFVTGINGLRAVAYSPGNDSLYWTSDATTGKISRSSVITPAIVDVITNLDEPMGIAIDPTYNGGSIFWSQGGTTPRLRRAGLSGTGAATLRNTEDGSYEIALDSKEGRVYYHEPTKIWSIFYNGTSATPLGPIAQAGHVPTGLAVYPGLRLYVRPTGNDANDGLSWGTALREVRTAIARLANGHPAEVWVQAGTYKPTSGTDRNQSFTLRTDLELYGGFNGTETSLSQRSIAANPTILSGDLLGNDGPPGSFSNYADNSFHVLRTSGSVTTSSVLDGFTIRGGYANTFSENARGGGLYAFGHPQVRDCRFEYNYSHDEGAAVYAIGGLSRFLRCRFYGNDGTSIVAFISGLPSLVNCHVHSNGAFYAAVEAYQGTTLTVTNCTINSNLCEVFGAVRATGTPASVALSNCVISYNRSATGMRNAQVVPANVTISNCYVQGWSAGGAGVLGYGTHPRFVNGAGPDGAMSTPDDDLHLTAASPLVNAGLNAAVPLDLTHDLDGNQRIRNGTVDLGAFEFTGTPAPYVPPAPMHFTNATPSVQMADQFNSVIIPRTSLLPNAMRWSIGSAQPGGGITLTFPLGSYAPGEIPAVQCDDVYALDVDDVPDEPYQFAGEIQVTYTLEGTVEGLAPEQRVIFGFDLGDDDQSSLLGGPNGDVMGAMAPFTFSTSHTGSVFFQQCAPESQANCEFGNFTPESAADTGELEYLQGFQFGDAYKQYGIDYGWHLAVVDYAPGATNTVTVTIDQMTVEFTVPELVLGDLNNDGMVGITDLLALLAAWGPCPAPPAACAADLNLDGSVGVGDLLLMLANWG